MVSLNDLLDSNTARYERDAVSFEISNEDVVFAPQAYPTMVKPSKERNKSRSDNLCEGETITDTGSKNMEINVTGYMPFSERGAFFRLLEEGGDLDLLSEEWSGEVQVLDGECERSGIDTLYYMVNLVSTGRDERGGVSGNGILSRGGSSTGPSGDFEANSITGVR